MFCLHLSLPRSFLYFRSIFIPRTERQVILNFSGGGEVSHLSYRALSLKSAPVLTSVTPQKGHHENKACALDPGRVGSRGDLWRRWACDSAASRPRRAASVEFSGTWFSPCEGLIIKHTHRTNQTGWWTHCRFLLFGKKKKKRNKFSDINTSSYHVGTRITNPQRMCPSP